MSLLDVVLSIAVHRDFTLAVDYFCGRWLVTFTTYGEGAFSRIEGGQTLAEALEPLIARLRAAGYLDDDDESAAG